MKKQKIALLLGIALLLLAVPGKSQLLIEGKIKNWNKGEGRLVYQDMITGDLTDMGSIDEKGGIKIPLSANFKQEVDLMTKKALENAPQGWSMRKNTVASTFNCNPDETIMTNGEAEVLGLPELELTDKEGMAENGYLYASNSQQVAEWLKSWGMENAGKRYYLRWFFVVEDASVNGECIIPTYTGNGDENYVDFTVVRLELKKGWNPIKTEYEELFTNQNGKTYASRTIISRIDETPEDLEWFALGGKDY
ncbi:MAG: hypothetical protein K0B09_10820 [Bacteroidales bacterium]|nr:hypothetical protein [Bacteroidales bacterium]